MTDFIIVDGEYRNTDEIRSIHPGNNGHVVVVIGSKLHHFFAGAGNEAAWAEAFATGIGRVFDPAEIPQAGDSYGGIFQPIPEEFLDTSAALPHDTSVIPPEIREHLPYRIAAGGRPAFDEAGK